MPKPWIALWACGISACAAQTPLESKKLPELDPVIGPKSDRGAEDAVLPRRTPSIEVIAIVGGTLLLGTGKRIEDGTLLISGGRIAAVGQRSAVPIPAAARQVEAEGKFVTPGLIDTHSHLGVYAVPYVNALADGNEMTDPTTPYVASEHSFWPQDPSIESAVAGGVTTIQVLPGSGNVIGGRAFTVKLRPAREARAMRFPGAPDGLKMACGENPKRVYGESGRQPMSRMGSIYKLRSAFIRARAYRVSERQAALERKKWQEKRAKVEAHEPGAEAPGTEPLGIERDLGLEVLADALDGKLKVHVHCYRADEMLLMIALSRELGFQISSFHHAVEAYKVADVLAQEGIAASMWSDWWGFKLESFDGIDENVALVAARGGQAIVHSDSADGIQRLNQEASKALASGRRAGLELNEDQALQWITLNPARALGIETETGSLEVGKMADVVIWDRSPFSIYSSAERVLIDGEETYQKGAGEPWSDFEVGSVGREVRR